MARPIGEVVNVRLDRADESIKTLLAISSRVLKRVMKKAARAGGALFVKAAKRNAPRRTSALKRSIRQKVKIYVVSGTVVSVIGARNRRLADGSNPAKYNHLVEGGTKPHKIEPRSGQVLHIKGQAVRSAQHPGAKPNPFMRRSADATIDASFNAFADKLAEETEKEARAV